MHELMAGGELLVIETEDDVYLGTVGLEDDHFVLRTSFVGRPVVLAPGDICSRVTVGGGMTSQPDAGVPGCPVSGSTFVGSFPPAG